MKLIELSNRFILYLLWPLSQIYLGIITIRNLRRKKMELKCPVISVGNIVLGGTGKTPAVEMLVRMLTTSGYRTAILSRGYRRKPTKATANFGIVSDGRTILLGSEESGDEPQQLARNLSEAAVLVGKDRFLTGNIALNKFDCDVIILDDGYQHISLKRNMDIVVINARQPFGNGCLLPIGSLREPKNSLNRANLFLLTHVDESTNLENLKQELKSFNPTAPIVESTHSPLYLRNIMTEEHVELKFLAGRDIFSLSSIGYPQSFENTLRNLGANLQDSFQFPDHHRYSLKEINKICCLVQEKGVNTIVTTQKDAMRLEQFRNSFFKHSIENILALVIELKIIRGKQILESMLSTLVKT